MMVETRTGRSFGWLAAALLAAPLTAAGCGGADPAAPTNAAAPEPAAAEAPAAPQYEIGRFAGGLVHPWALAALPDGRMLVTERPGRLRLVGRDGSLSEPLGGVPEVFAQGQGGLLDVAIDPAFADNNIVYLSFAEPGPDGGAGTAVARARLGPTALEGLEVIFRQQPKVAGGNHFGSRLAFAPDGHLFVTLGERFLGEPAQDNSNHLGTIVRIRPDGSIPEGNPFADGKEGALPAIWSFGHRNIEAAAVHPRSGRLWVAEMGPRGGDELNLPEAGRNYGWPLVSWGRHYDGRDIPDPPTRPDLAQSIRQWTPVISPSGMIFYDGAAFPDWSGNLLIGGLTAQGVVRLTLNGSQVSAEERIEVGKRIREVEQGVDGAVYVLTDEADGEILRIAPPRAQSGR